MTLLMYTIIQVSKLFVYYLVQRNCFYADKLYIGIPREICLEDGVWLRIDRAPAETTPRDTNSRILCRHP